MCLIGQFVPSLIVLLSRDDGMPLPEIIILIWIGCAVAAIQNFPRRDQAAKRRLVWLGLLAVPLAAAIAFGPLVLDAHALSDDQRRHMINLQYIAFASSLLIPVALIPFMRGARIFAAAIAVAIAVLCFVHTAISVTISEPSDQLPEPAPRQDLSDRLP